MSVKEVSSEIRQVGIAKFVKVKGTSLQRAKEFGRLTKENKLSKESVEYFAEVFSRRLNEISKFAALAGDGIFWVWRKRWLSKQPKDFMEELKAFCQEAEIDFAQLQKAMGMPDFVAFIELLNGLGCTTVSRKLGDSFVIGRNLDFSGVGVWDKHPLVAIHLPEDHSNELKHIAFSTDPLFFGSITAINEKGIFLALHQNYTNDVWGTGVPIYLIGERVMREAHNLEEATEILLKYRPGQLWTYNIADLNTGETKAIEISASAIKERKVSQGLFSQTNHLISSDHPKELMSTPKKFNSKWRLEFIKKHIENETSENIAKKVANGLAHQHQEGIHIHESVIKPITIQTVIAEKNSKGHIMLYFASEMAPTSNGKYIQFSLDDIFNKNLSELQLTEENMSQTCPLVREQHREINKVFILWEDGKVAEALDLIKDEWGPVAILIKSIGHFMLGKYSEALELSNQLLVGHQLKKSHHEINHLDVTYQQAQILKVLSLLKLNRSTEACEFAQGVHLQDICCERSQIVLQKVLSLKKLSYLDNTINYDWFAGGLSWDLIL